MTEATKQKLAETQKESSRIAIRRRNREEEKEEIGIETNTFYSIIMADDVELEEKVNQVSKALEFTNDKESDRTRIKEFEQFKEYLQSISETMSKQRIEMTDTGTFSELQKVYGDFNNDLNDFIDKIKPLTDITAAGIPTGQAKCEVISYGLRYRLVMIFNYYPQILQVNCQIEE